MIVKCEQCNTKFRLNPEQLKGSKTRVRCSRCGNVFEVSKGEGAEPEGSQFVEEKPSLGKDRPSSPPKVSQRVSPPKMKKRRGTQILKRVLVLLVLVAVLFGLWKVGYNIFTALLSDEPATAKKPSVVIGDSLQAYFLENRHSGQIFVVEGEAVNQSDEPVSFILLEGEVYNTQNEVAQSQMCYAGNVLSESDLRSLPVEEIQERMRNKEGPNLVNVHVPPDRKVPFMVVYHNLPPLDELTDYSIEVAGYESG